MASLIMHLAVAVQLYPPLGVPVSERERFLWGQLLPDARGEGTAAKRTTHFRTIPPDGTQVCDFPRFLRDFPPHTDSLYLGYYCHLCEDWTFRHFLYDICGIVPTPALAPTLHRDYSLLNAPLIREYSLAFDFGKPPEIPAPLMTYFPYDTAGLYAALRAHFTDPATENETPTLFTFHMAREYIAIAVADTLNGVQKAANR